MLAESIPLWTIDSVATNHIARDRGTYVEFWRISSSTRWIYVGNNSKIKVKGIGTCKLELCRGHTLFLHDVLYVPDIRWNLVFVLVLLGLGFNLNFHDSIMKLYLGTTYYGSGLWFLTLIIVYCLMLMIAIIRWWLLLEIHVIMWSYDMLDLGILDKKEWID